MKKNIIICLLGVILSAVLIINVMDQQLTYPLDSKSVAVLSAATDKFLYQKIFDLEWKKLFHYYTDFPSMDGFGVTGTVTFSGEGSWITLTTTNISGNKTLVQKYSAMNGLMTFGQPSNFRTSINAVVASNFTAYVTIGSTDSATSGYYYGFKFVNGTLYGVTSNAGTNAENAVSLKTGIVDDTNLFLEARYDPSNNVVFFLNDVQVGISRTSIPKPTETANSYFYEITAKTTTASTRFLNVGFFEYLQRRNILK